MCLVDRVYRVNLVNLFMHVIHDTIVALAIRAIIVVLVVRVSHAIIVTIVISFIIVILVIPAIRVTC